MADKRFQTFPRVLRPLFATLPLFTTFFVCRISLVVNIVKGCRLIEGVYIILLRLCLRFIAQQLFEGSNLRVFILSGRKTFVRQLLRQIIS